MTDLLAMQWQQIIDSSWLMIVSVMGFWLGISVYRRSSGKPLLHTLIIGTPFIAVLLALMNIDFDGEHHFRLLPLIGHMWYIYFHRFHCFSVLLSPHNGARRGEDNY